MSEPTKEIIELSKKLNELGHRQEIKKGDWCLEEATMGKNRWFNLKLWTDELCCASDVVKFIPIPSLDDALEWLKKQCIKNEGDGGSFVHVGWSCFDKEWYVEIQYDLNERDSMLDYLGNTPHEAVLLAMCKALEAQNDK